jgi:hypothetical protein
VVSIIPTGWQKTKPLSTCFRLSPSKSTPFGPPQISLAGKRAFHFIAISPKTGGIAPFFRPDTARFRSFGAGTPNWPSMGFQHQIRDELKSGDLCIDGAEE